MQLHRLPAHELVKLLRDKKVSPVEVAKQHLERIESIDGKIHAFVRVEPDKVLSAAKELETKGPFGRLYGVPVGIKDLICTRGEETTCCSKILKGYFPPYNATVVDKLLAEGALPFGKTNMDEFAFGSSTETSCYGITRNPWAMDRVPGGSSGGSAAAVAADLATACLGSDTGGSIRQPAAFCGVVGMKPTYGRVSRYGLIAFASGLDQIGPITKDVEDCAMLMNVIAGHDAMDSTSAREQVPDYTQALGKDIKSLRIGVPKEYFIEGMDAEVEGKVREAIDFLARNGAEVEEISLPHSEYAVGVYYIVATSEASSNLARFDGVQYGHRAVLEKGTEDALIESYKRTRTEGFGNEAKRRILLGTFALSSGYYDAYYLKAQKVRTLIKRDFESAFLRCDVIVTPTSPTPAFKTGEKTQDPLTMYLSDIFTISVNLAGIPGVSMPCGFTGEGLPVGLQILSAPFQEEKIFRVAHFFESRNGFQTRKPEV